MLGQIDVRQAGAEPFEIATTPGVEEPAERDDLRQDGVE
jgi:hypothetical protein